MYRHFFGFVFTKAHVIFNWNIKWVKKKKLLSISSKRLNQVQMENPKMKKNKVMVIYYIIAVIEKK